jgi:hypothetical protein
MNKAEFVRHLKATAEVLKPLTHAASFGAATWNGVEYVKGGKKAPDPYALSWWSTLIAVAELIDAQDGSLTANQIDYLDRLLFGGMGSLNDLFFDAKLIGANADVVNKELDKSRHALFISFKN